MYNHEIKKELRDIWIMIIVICLAVVTLTVILLINTVRSMTPVIAKEAQNEPIRSENDLCGLSSIVCENEPPEEKIRVLDAIVYSYNSEVSQTDSTPCITASGYNPCKDYSLKNIVANNCLKFGTIVEIEGVKFEVQDRMNNRYSCEYFDIWFPNKEDSIKWGVKNLEVKIYD